MRLIFSICFLVVAHAVLAGVVDQVPPVKGTVIQELNTDGFVEVSLKIDQQGKIEVISIQSSNSQLSEYVLNKLAQTKLEPGSSEPGKVVKYRFVFKKQA
jgi:hypothetical protein